MLPRRKPDLRRQWNTCRSSATLSTFDLYAGGTRYDALASLAGPTNIVGNLRVESSRLFAYVSAAAPIDREAPVWSALGGGARIGRALGHGVRIGLELDGDGYVFRRTTGETGSGLTTHVVPLVAWTRGVASVQLRGGRHDSHAELDGASSRYLNEAGVRGTVGDIDRFAIADVRVFTADDEYYPMLRVQLGTTIGGARVWGTAGRWFGDLRQTEWGAGVSTGVGSRGEVWAGVRRDAADPLYLNPARTSWNVGYSHRIGRASSVIRGPEVRNGALVLRLARGAAHSAPSVAGEFNNWQPVPMRAAGDEWLVELPVTSGVYRFAFVAASGEWFVPEGYPGRMDDDMGGHVAVVAVP
jgi:hypothetical protein